MPNWKLALTTLILGTFAGNTAAQTTAAPIAAPVVGTPPVVAPPVVAPPVVAPPVVAPPIVRPPVAPAPAPVPVPVAPAGIVAPPAPLTTRIPSSQPFAGGSLKSVITVKVDNITPLLKLAQAANTKPVLFLDGREMTNIFGTLHKYDKTTDGGTLSFRLDRDTTNADAWKPLLSAPSLTPRKISLSIGLPKGQPVETAWQDFELTVIHTDWLLAWFAALIALFVAFVHWARKTAMLRESGVPPAGKMAAFSLAKCQMAWWFFLAIASFAFLYMVSWDFNTITSGTLTLIGISAATGLAAVTVDSSAKNTLLAELNATPPPTPDRQAAIMKQLATPPHVDFFDDVLTDGAGLSFHRVQMMAWTIVLGVIFVLNVYHDLIMPDFSPTLLGLMGISSGTYIGFKLPETKN